MTTAIRTGQLSKRYLRLQALDQVSLEVPQGAAYALVGPNGAGKTTLIKILLNLIASSGGSAEVLGLSTKQIRGSAYEQIGYVSENQEIPEWMKAGALLDYLREFYPTWDRDLENSLVRQFDLPLDRKIKALSRGMRMKLALAGALAFHPRLIILDEPFGGLDPLVRDQLIEGLLERAQESTIFISSHDLAEIESFATHVGYLEQGRLLFSDEMTSLSARFREVELTLENPLPLPAGLPPSWLQASSAGAVVRFVDSQFEAEKCAADIRNSFGNVRDAAYRAMGLRAIFLAMARKSGGAKEA
jgi:ABC-2 type transport system ATP-binding protein